MHTALEFLLQGTVGFAIGAGTNDLAIRWVFWALLSKKKHEIAEAVQKVVSSELMSPDKIVAPCPPRKSPRACVRRRRPPSNRP